jgi:cytidylate kinase
VGELLVVTGPPGAGKSTVSAVLAAGFSSSALVAGDQFFGFINKGYVAPWLAEAHTQNRVVVDAAAAAAGRLARGDYTVVYDGVIGPWFVAEFAAACQAPRLHYAILMPPEAVAVERVRTREGHGFTDLEAARHMYRDFRDAEVDPRHVVAGEVGDADVVARAVRQRMDAGRLLWQ